MSSLKKALTQAGIYDTFAAAVQPPTRAALAEPNAESWFPGAVVEDIWQTLVKKYGPQQLSDINYLVAKQSFGPVVMPVIKVALALTGNSPASVAARLESMLKLAIRPVKIIWHATDANSGTITIQYPRPIVLVAEHAWGGVFRFMFEITGRQGTVERFEPLEGASQFRLTLRWK
ncbi:MAG: hypothetical protein QM723_39075 [Myxococcaceae bacterium]